MLEATAGSSFTHIELMRPVKRGLKMDLDNVATEMTVWLSANHTLWFPLGFSDHVCAYYMAPKSIHRLPKVP